MIWQMIGGIGIFIGAYTAGHFAGFCVGLELKEKKEKLEAVQTQPARA